MKKVHVSCACSQEELDRATLFIQEGYKKSFNIVPGGVAWYVTGSDEEGKLLSVLGLQLCTNGISPLHQLFDVSRSTFPPDYDLQRSAYYSRFVSHVKGISPLLFYVATQYALEEGCRYGSAVFLTYMHKHFSGMNCAEVWQPLEHAIFNIDSVTPDYLTYFLNPELRCYVANLHEKAERLEPFVQNILKDGNVSCDSSIRRRLHRFNTHTGP